MTSPTSLVPFPKNLPVKDPYGMILWFVGRGDTQYDALDLGFLAGLHMLGAGTRAVGHFNVARLRLLADEQGLQGTVAHNAQQVGGEGGVVAQDAFEFGLHHAFKVAVAAAVGLQSGGGAAVVVFAL